MHVYLSSSFLVSSGNANIENFLYWENGQSRKQTMSCFFFYKKHFTGQFRMKSRGSNTFWSMEAQEWLCIFTQDNSHRYTIRVALSPWKQKSHRLSVFLNYIVFLFFFLYSYFIVLSAQVRWNQKHKECWRILFYQILLKQSEMYGLTRSH